MKNKDILKQTIEEFLRSQDFIRLFPSKNCDKYNKYFKNKRGSNVFIYKALFTEDILPLEAQPYSDLVGSTTLEKNSEAAVVESPKKSTPKIKLKKQILSTQDLSVTKMEEQHSNSECATFMTTQTKVRTVKESRPKTSKLFEVKSAKEAHISDLKSVSTTSILPKIITGDDLLIEYVNRVIKVLRLLKEEDINYEQKAVLEKFITHPAWITIDLSQTVKHCFEWQRLEARMVEMKDRRRRLAKSIADKDKIIKQFDKQYDRIMKK